MVEATQSRTTTGPVAGARTGDHGAWTELVRRHEGLLHYICRQHGLGDHDRADVVQETWLIAMEKIGQLRQDHRFTSWLGTICRRCCLRLVDRARACRVEDPLDSPVLHLLTDTADLEAEVVHRDDLANLEAAVDALPRQQRILLAALISADFVDYATTAATLVIPVGGIGPTRVRAIATLRRDPRLMATG